MPVVCLWHRWRDRPWGQGWGAAAARTITKQMIRENQYLAKAELGGMSRWFFHSVATICLSISCSSSSSSCGAPPSALESRDDEKRKEDRPAAETDIMSGRKSLLHTSGGKKEVTGPTLEDKHDSDIRTQAKPPCNRLSLI